MKVRWKCGETPLFPLYYRKSVLPDGEGLFALNFWWEVMGLGAYMWETVGGARE